MGQWDRVGLLKLLELVEAVKLVEEVVGAVGEHIAAEALRHAGRCGSRHGGWRYGRRSWRYGRGGGCRFCRKRRGNRRAGGFYRRDRRGRGRGRGGCRFCRVWGSYP